MGMGMMRSDSFIEALCKPLLALSLVCISSVARAQSVVESDSLNEAFAAESQGRLLPSVIAGVRSTLNLSTNPNLATTNADYRSGAAAEVSPYVFMNSERPDRNYKLQYFARNFYSSSTQEYSWLRHQLKAQGETSVVHDWLKVGARVYSFDVNANPVGILSVDPAAQSTNRTRSTHVDLVPTIRGETANGIEYDARYIFSSSRFESLLPSSHSNRFSGLLKHSPNYGGLGWGGAIDSESREYDVGSSVKVARGWLGPFLYPIRDFQLESQPTMRVTVGCSIRKVRIPAGVLASIYFGSRRHVQVYTRGYFAPTTALLLSYKLVHRHERWVVGVRYDKDVSTSMASSSNTLDPSSVFRIREDATSQDPISSRLSDSEVLPTFPTSLVTNGINSLLSRNAIFTASIGLADGKNALYLSASRSNRTAVGSGVLAQTSENLFNDVQSSTVSLEGRRSLSATLASGAIVRWTNTSVDGDTISTKFLAISPFFRLLVSRESSLMLRYRIAGSYPKVLTRASSTTMRYSRQPTTVFSPNFFGAESGVFLNAFSVDVEDYFQVSAFAPYISRSDWDHIPRRVEANVDRLLELLDLSSNKGTFFVLGWIAERHPLMIRRIAKAGHEVANHGYSHLRVTDQAESEFRLDVVRAKRILEDLIGAQVIGYRAPSFSIDARTPWAYSVLEDTGHRYSSSVYPIKHDHYGMPEAPRFAHAVGKSITEIPPSTVRMVRRNFPASGGGYFRLLPYTVSSWMIARVESLDQKPVIFYCHPWEIDPEQPRVTGIDFRTKVRHYINLARTESRLRRLLSERRWDRMDQVFGLNADLQSGAVASQ